MKTAVETTVVRHKVGDYVFHKDTWRYGWVTKIHANWPGHMTVQHAPFNWDWEKLHDWRIDNKTSIEIARVPGAS